VFGFVIEDGAYLRIIVRAKLGKHLTNRTGVKNVDPVGPSKLPRRNRAIVNSRGVRSR
jgi:hypothetical protein